MPDKYTPIWPISLARVEQVVSAHLGPGRVRGNAQPGCFSRQVSMYLAKHVAGWSLPKIGRFYNGRHHTSVLHSVKKIEKLRNTDEAIDALIEVLTAELSADLHDHVWTSASTSRSVLVDVVAARVIERLNEIGSAAFSQQTEGAGNAALSRAGANSPPLTASI